MKIWQRIFYKPLQPMLLAVRHQLNCRETRPNPVPLSDISLMEQDDDILDATVCVLAGFHFINNKCMPPLDIDLARKEAWIWVKKPDNE